MLLAAGNPGAEFPALFNTEPNINSTPMPAAEVAASMKLPPGFRATVFASEPQVQNPIAMSWDARGRLWIAENYTYSERGKQFELRLRDRIVIFDDTDGDGKSDTRKVFTDELQRLTSVEVGLGGVWVMCPPQLLFIPDRDRNDVPDRTPEVVLDGFHVPPENYHNFANGLRFGPDGWLYGRCGASSPGEVGRPGATAEQRISLRGTLWRYHPRRKVFEALSHGTTNPWGHDWDAQGELFFINTVNGHLWHGITGAHYVRPHTIDPNPHVYEVIDQHADHWHFDTGQGWMKSRDGAANNFGGGHAHIGMMIYQGDNWPAEYRGRLFTLNMHGRRANQELLERSGSGYVGRHGADFFLAPDPWFRGMELSYGPDGGVFVLDWSDTGECHDSTGVHRTSGRIYKVTYGQPQPTGVSDLGQIGAEELVKLHTRTNEWFARQARLELARRAAESLDITTATSQLRAAVASANDTTLKLRALWSLYAIGQGDEAYLKSLLRHANEHVRVWAIRLLSDSWPLDTVMSDRPQTPAPPPKEELIRSFVALARDDPSALVRLTLASTLQRLPHEHRAAIASALVTHKRDANDHNLPAMVWYGLIPLGKNQPNPLAQIARKCEWPLTCKWIARRLAEDIETQASPVNELLEAVAASKSEAFQQDILDGLAEAFVGWRKVTPPAAWTRVKSKLAGTLNEPLAEVVRDLSVLFGDGRALDEVKRLALDTKAELPARKAALKTLVESRPPDLRTVCESLLSVRFLNPIAARGLAQFDDPAVGARLAGAYGQFHPTERPQLLTTLVSRPSFARALLDAIEQRKIPRSDLQPFHARQIRGFQNTALTERLGEVWGQLRETDTDKGRRIAEWKRQFSPGTLVQADKSQGRAVFNLACASCHRLYGEGGEIGPDLTGAGRDNLDYLLENVVDPSAVVTADYRLSILDLKDGRVLNGVIKASNNRTVTLQTAADVVTLERTEISRTQPSTLSLMPDGLLDSLTATQARDLIAYLMDSAQAPLPATAASRPEPAR